MPYSYLLPTRCWCAVALLASPAVFAQYSGPQILSPAGMSIASAGRPTAFRFYAGLQGEVNSGLISASVDPEGRLTSVPTLYGTTLNVGAYGSKSSRYTSVILNFNANFRHYWPTQYYDGIDTVLSLGVGRRLTNRVTVSFVNTGGTISQGFGALHGYVENTSQYVGLPVNNIFDNRMYFWQTAGSVIYEKSARWSFNAGGTGFFMRPQTKALVGTDGYGGSAGTVYRFTRRTSMMAQYNFYHFDYPDAFGESDIHMALAGISYELTRYWSATVSAGVSRMGTVGVTQVAADPVTAALFGQKEITRAFRTVDYFPAIHVSAGRRLSHGSLMFSFSEAPSPGNGIYLTSNSYSASGTYARAATKNTSASFNISYSRLQGIGQEELGTFQYVMATLSGSRRIRESLHATAGVFARRMLIGVGSNYPPMAYGVTAGVTFSPGERPLIFW